MKVGGLGILTLSTFNKVLGMGSSHGDLGLENGYLWKHVICSNYGADWGEGRVRFPLDTKNFFVKAYSK